MSLIAKENVSTASCASASALARRFSGCAVALSVNAIPKRLLSAAMSARIVATSSLVVAFSNLACSSAIARLIRLIRVIEASCSAPPLIPTLPASFSCPIACSLAIIWSIILSLLPSA